MEVLLTDDLDGEGDEWPSEIELGARADLEKSVLAQAAMRDCRSTLAEAAIGDFRSGAAAEAASAQLLSASDFLRLAGSESGAIVEAAGTASIYAIPDADDFLRLAGFDGHKFGEAVIRYTGMDDAIAAMVRSSGVQDGIAAMVRASGVYDDIMSAARTVWEESEATRRLQETVGAAAMFCLPDDHLHGAADVMLGLADNPLRGLADATFAMSLNPAFEVADGLNLERASVLRAELDADYSLGLGSSIVVPPVDFLLADSFPRGEADGFVPRRFTDQILELVPTPDRLLIGDRYYQPTYSVPPVDDAADPLPDDAVLIHELRVSGGSLSQIGNLFEHYFGAARSPERFFIVRERQESSWTIYYAEDTGRDARERAKDANGVAGFIVVIDLPVAMVVEFYKVVESEEARISAFVERLQKGIEASGFKLDITGQKVTRETSAGVSERLRKLRELREVRKVNGVVRITRFAAYVEVGIDSRTVKKHEPELHERWEDSEF